MINSTYSVKKKNKEDSVATKLFHIFRNNPLGRETLLQSVHFCKTVEISLVIYIPKQKKFLMYFENDMVKIDLDKSYLKSPKTAKKHASKIVESAEITASFIELKRKARRKLPDIRPNFATVTCHLKSVSGISAPGLGVL